MPFTCRLPSGCCFSVGARDSACINFALTLHCRNAERCTSPTLDKTPNPKLEGPNATQALFYSFCRFFKQTYKSAEGPGAGTGLALRSGSKGGQLPPRPSTRGSARGFETYMLHSACHRYYRPHGRKAGVRSRAAVRARDGSEHARSQWALARQPRRSPTWSTHLSPGAFDVFSIESATSGSLNDSISNDEGLTMLCEYVVPHRWSVARQDIFWTLIMLHYCQTEIVNSSLQASSSSSHVKSRW